MFMFLCVWGFRFQELIDLRGDTFGGSLGTWGSGSHGSKCSRGSLKKNGKQKEERMPKGRWKISREGTDRK
jgi:hypothetical protein